MKQFVRVTPDAIETPPMGSEARKEAGYLIRSLQKGLALAPPKVKRMPTIGAGCLELRIQDGEQNQTWRIICHVDKDAVVLLDWFSKKTNKTPKGVLEASKARLRRYKATT